MSDEQFEQAFRAVRVRDAGYDLCLTEAIRRGGQNWQDFLEARLEEAHRQASQHAWANPTLRLVTAVRRIQKKNDPVMILVPGSARRACDLRSEVIFDVSLANVDTERATVRFISGGDYRGSREAKWRFEVKDANGNMLPQIVDYSIGGFTHEEVLGFGASLATRLDMANYVLIDVPGNYTVQVLYHDAVHLAEVTDLTGLVVCRSVPFELQVEPVEVELSAATKRNVTQWIAGLPNSGPVKIHAGMYCEESHAFIPAESAAGQLLSLGWPAVPGLIEAATAADADPGRRAWVIGILYGITGRNDPRDAAGVLGPYEYWHSGRVTAGLGGGGFSLTTMKMGVLVGEIDSKKQAEFAQRWRVWLDKNYIRVTKPARNHTP